MLVTTENRNKVPQRNYSGLKLSDTGCSKCFISLTDSPEQASDHAQYSQLFFHAPLQVAEKQVYSSGAIIPGTDDSVLFIFS